MSSQTTATVRMFGTLRVLRQNRGLATVAEVSIPACGCAASVLARGLDLPVENIETVFVNQQAHYLDHCILPGDKVAFISKKSPAPYGRLRT